MCVYTYIYIYIYIYICMNKGKGRGRGQEARKGEHAPFCVKGNSCSWADLSVRLSSPLAVAPFLPSATSQSPSSSLFSLNSSSPTLRSHSSSTSGAAIPSCVPACLPACLPAGPTD